MRLGTNELIIILLVVVVIFGPTQIPKLTKMFGKSVKNFKDGMADDESGDGAAAKKAQKAEKDAKAPDEDES